MTGVRLPAVQDFSLCHSVQTGSGAYPIPYPVGTGVLSSGVKRPGREANHSPPSTAEVKNVYSHTPTPPYVCKPWCLVKHQGQLYRVLWQDISTCIEQPAKLICRTSSNYMIDL
jgi:hypothetical protein